MNTQHLCEWSGSLLGLLGAFLVATHSQSSKYGWLAFLAANAAMIAFALQIGAWGLLLQQVGFTATSLLGLRRAWSSAATAHSTRRPPRGAPAFLASSETLTNGRYRWTKS
jgi:hypothetical protein